MQFTNATIKLPTNTHCFFLLTLSYIFKSHTTKNINFHVPVIISKQCVLI
jgi:hypothetical protein